MGRQYHKEGFLCFSHQMEQCIKITRSLLRKAVAFKLYQFHPKQIKKK